MAELKDSGNRREFKSGAVRDVADGKGRCDLLTLHQVARALNDEMLEHIAMFMDTGDISYLYDAIDHFIEFRYPDYITAILELAKQYEDGARKYSDNNWKKGIPLHCFIDSGVRHYLKDSRGDSDEPHSRGTLWNLFGAIWTIENHPELIDIEFELNKKENPIEKTANSV